MSTETQRTWRTRVQHGNWTAGAVGGIVGAFGMGFLMLAMNAAVIAVAIPSLYTLAPPPNPILGMAVHLFHGAVLGLVFAGLVEALDVQGTGSVVGLALAWGAVTWIVLAALLMPVWLSAVGSPANPPFPNFAPPSLLWHLTYGLLLGGVYAATGGRA